MDEEKKLKMLQNCFPQLLKSMNPDSLYPVLFSKSLLNSEEVERLSKFEKTTKEKNSLIVLALRYKGTGAFSGFIEALRETSEENPAHNELIRLLLNQETET